MSPATPTDTPSGAIETTSNEVLLKLLVILTLYSFITGLGTRIGSLRLTLVFELASLVVGIGVDQFITLLFQERHKLRGLLQPAKKLRDGEPLVKVLVLVLSLPFWL